MESFMTNETSGNKETFYIHTLRFYMIDVMVDTYAKHKLGPGIWTMEGFEGVKQVSKHIFCNLINIKVNLSSQSLSTIILQFTTKIHSVANELAKEAKK